MRNRDSNVTEAVCQLEALSGGHSLGLLLDSNIVKWDGLEAGDVVGG